MKDMESKLKDGNKAYGAKNDFTGRRARTESEIREYHEKHNHSGKFLQCEECSKTFGSDYTMDDSKA